MILRVGTFDGKVVLVTGGAQGIGRAAADAFARQGARVVVADVAKSADVLADVTRAEDCEAMVRETVRRHGRLDIAFNNAGIEGAIAKLADAPIDDFERVMAVNLRGVFFSMRAEIPAMLAAGGGSVVNAASVAGIAGWMGAAAYTASKHAVVGLTRTAALDYARKGIRVNCVCPGVTRTPMLERMIAGRAEMEEAYARRIPQGRFATADEVAAAVLWLASDAAAHVTGVALPVDGGLSAL